MVVVSAHSVIILVKAAACSEHVPYMFDVALIAVSEFSLLLSKGRHSSLAPNSVAVGVVVLVLVLVDVELVVLVLVLVLVVVDVEVDVLVVVVVEVEVLLEVELVVLVLVLVLVDVEVVVLVLVLVLVVVDVEVMVVVVSVVVGVVTMHGAMKPSCVKALSIPFKIIADASQVSVLSSMTKTSLSHTMIPSNVGPPPGFGPLNSCASIVNRAAASSHTV